MLVHSIALPNTNLVWSVPASSPALTSVRVNQPNTQFYTEHFVDHTHRGRFRQHQPAMGYRDSLSATKSRHSSLSLIKSFKNYFLGIDVFLGNKLLDYVNWTVRLRASNCWCWTSSLFAQYDQPNVFDHHLGAYTMTAGSDAPTYYSLCVRYGLQMTNAQLKCFLDTKPVCNTSQGVE